jgi:transcriptional regulator with GAF, ATPase, and Fis domain
MKINGDDAQAHDGVYRYNDMAVHRELSRLLIGSQPLSEVLDRVAHLARAAVPGIDEVSVTLVQEGRAGTVVFTGDLAVQLDERQYEDGFGPCLDAARTGQVIQVADTSSDTAYPDYARQAARSGVTRSLSLGLPILGETVGALNMYARSGHGFDAATVAAADDFLVPAAVAVGNAALYQHTTAQVEQLHEAMAYRSVIEQAKGMIMASRQCTETKPSPSSSTCPRRRTASCGSWRKRSSPATDAISEISRTCRLGTDGRRHARSTCSPARPEHPPPRSTCQPGACRRATWNAPLH